MKLFLFITVLLSGYIGLGQNTGIGTLTPSESLDVGIGGLRVRDITSATYTSNTTADRMVVADATGVLKTAPVTNYKLFHARLAANQAIDNASVIPASLIFTTPLATSAIYSYNAATGVLTFQESGNYLVTLQAGFSISGSTAVPAQMTIGIRPVPDAAYLGRGSHTITFATAGSVGELINYTTMLIVPSVGYQIKFTAASNVDSTVLNNETGTTGSGNVTNVTVQKI